MAQDAIHEAYRAQSSVIEVKRSIKRVKSVWGTLTVIGIILGAGFGLATYLGQFETHEKAKTMAVSIEDAEKEMAAIRESHRNITERLNRLEQKLDKFLERLIRERGR